MAKAAEVGVEAVVEVVVVASQPGQASASLSPMGPVRHRL